MLIFPQEIGPGPLEMLGDGPHRRLDIPATEAVVEFAVLAVVAGDPLGVRIVSLLRFHWPMAAHVVDLP